MEYPYLVGAGVRDITPPDDAISDGRIFMPGYGVMNATGVSHPLSARALAVADIETGKRIVLVTTDLAAVDRSLVTQWRSLLQTEARLDPEEVLIQAIHTHKAPLARIWPVYMEPHAVPDEEFMKILSDGVVMAVKDAIASMTEASLTFGRGTSRIGYNRRYAPTRDVFDDTLDVLEARSAKDVPIATVFFYACHPVALGDRFSELSPDFPGVARDLVEAERGGTALFVQAFGGTIDPAPDVEWGDRNLEVMMQVGTTLATDVLSVMQQSMRVIPAGISTNSGFVALPLIDEQSAKIAPAYAAVGKPMPTSLETEVQTFRAGSVDEDAWRLVGISNEVVNEYSQAVRDLFPDEAWVSLAGYSNGVHSYLPCGYMTTERPPGSNYEGHDAQVNNYGLPGPCTCDVDKILLAAVAQLRRGCVVGQSADAIIAGGWGLVALQAGTGVPFHYLDTPGQWEQVGQPAAQFAITNDALYGLADDRQTIWRYTGTGQLWIQVGESADALVAGGWGLIALQAGTGVPFRYLGTPGHWEQVGGPAAQFAITGDALYGLASDFQTIWRYTGAGQLWVQVGESADALVAGGWGLIALQAGTRVPFHYLGTPGQWEQVGEPAAEFAISNDALYGLADDRQNIWRYTGDAQLWVHIGDAANSISAGATTLFALGPDKSRITQL